FAIIEPAVAGLGGAPLVGWLLVFGGVTPFVSAVEGGGAERVIFPILPGGLFLVGGCFFVSRPPVALRTLPLLLSPRICAALAALFLAAGVCEIISYSRLRAEQASGWMLFNGIVALFLGALIWLHWPSSSVWAIGTLVGVNLLLTGITRLMVGLTGRRLIRHATA